MLDKIIDSFKKIFEPETIYDNVDAYIVAGNPQTPDDVERLERGFYERYNRGFWWDLNSK